MKPKSIKFKKNESFYIRDGWFEKALNTIAENKDGNVFYKNNGITFLGIGSNMVKGLKYWLNASNIIVTHGSKTVLGGLGENVYKHDRYFESLFSRYFVHYFLACNYVECPVIYGTFNSNLNSFKKHDLVEYLSTVYSADGFNTRIEYIEDDTSVLLKSYISDEIIENPEDNYVCPLSTLRLLEKNGDEIKRSRPSYRSLSYLIVYYALAQLYEYKSFKIEESMDEHNSPFLLFNLDKNMYFQYFEEMKKNKLIIINKAAGLNTVYFEKKLTLDDVFELYFGGDTNV